jgi:hypothetical protein
VLHFKVDIRQHALRIPVCFTEMALPPRTSSIAVAMVTGPELGNLSADAAFVKFDLLEPRSGGQ